MNGIQCKSIMWAFIFWISCHMVAVAQAENHALLIGIGIYKNRSLEGPPHDVAALARVLEAQYSFKKENIRTLINQEAVKYRILNEIERLTQRTHVGDRIFIYFSGHGTSRGDELLALPLPHTSGALVPADFNGDPNQPVEELMSQLIIGRRDLQPMLKRLDEDKQVLMVFDTCFSGNTVRAVGNHTSKDVSRHIPLQPKRFFAEEKEIGTFTENLKINNSYPYRNIFYISASTENEIAKDIRKDMLYIFPTIDGKPHGVLTDAFLKVLAGNVLVDTNNDGQWSQLELYQAVRSEVQRRFRQTPQALPKQGENARRLHSQPFFVRSAGNIGRPHGAQSNLQPTLRVQVNDDLANIKTYVSQIGGVKIVKSKPDLIITKDAEDIVLALPKLSSCLMILF